MTQSTTIPAPNDDTDIETSPSQLDRQEIALFDADFPEELRHSAPPAIRTEPVPACPVCSGESHRPYSFGFDYELGTCRNRWTFVCCKTCSHVWLNPRPAISELSVIYPPHYYAYDFEGKVHPIALKGKEMLDALKMREVFKLLGKPLTSFVDVGCGSGRFLRVAQKRGVEQSNIYGLELDPKVIEKLRAEGFQAFCERAEECTSIPSGSIDLATMFHVIEHVDDPMSVVARIKDWLRPGGVLAIETPNIDSFDARLFGRTYWGGYHIPRHWNLFSPASLSALLESAGYKVEAIKYQTGHSFWMYSMHHWVRYGLGRHSRTAAAVGKWFDPLKGLPFLIGFTALDKLRAALGCRTSAMLILARKIA